MFLVSWFFVSSPSHQNFLQPNKVTNYVKLYQVNITNRVSMSNSNPSLLPQEQWYPWLVLYVYIKDHLTLLNCRWGELFVVEEVRVPDFQVFFMLPWSPGLVRKPPGTPRVSLCASGTFSGISWASGISGIHSPSSKSSSWSLRVSGGFLGINQELHDVLLGSGTSGTSQSSTQPSSRSPGSSRYPVKMIYYVIL